MNEYTKSHCSICSRTLRADEGLVIYATNPPSPCATWEVPEIHVAKRTVALTKALSPVDPHDSDYTLPHDYHVELCGQQCAFIAFERALHTLVTGEGPLFA